MCGLQRMHSMRPHCAAAEGGSGIGLSTAPSSEQLEQQQPAVKGWQRAGYGPGTIAEMMSDQPASGGPTGWQVCCVLHLHCPPSLLSLAVP